MIWGFLVYLGMGTIRALRKGLQSLQVESEIVKIFQRTSKEIIRLNQNQLYFSSEDSLGIKLAPYKSKVYAAEKIFTNPNLPFGAPDLKLTGAFYRGFNIAVGYTGIFTIDSTDSKSGKVEAKYGSFIFGLNKQNKTDYGKNTFYPALQGYITKRTGLRFH